MKGNKDTKHKGSKDTFGPSSPPRGLLRFFLAPHHSTRSPLHSNSSFLHFAPLLRACPRYCYDRNHLKPEILWSSDSFSSCNTCSSAGTGSTPLQPTSRRHVPSRLCASRRCKRRDLRISATSTQSATTALCCTDIGYLTTPVSAD